MWMLRMEVHTTDVVTRASVWQASACERRWRTRRIKDHRGEGALWATLDGERHRQARFLGPREGLRDEDWCTGGVRCWKRAMPEVSDGHSIQEEVERAHLSDQLG